VRLRSVQDPRGVLKELHLGRWERGKGGGGTESAIERGDRYGWRKNSEIERGMGVGTGIVKMGGLDLVPLVVFDCG